MNLGVPITTWPAGTHPALTRSGWVLNPPWHRASLGVGRVEFKASLPPTLPTPHIYIYKIFFLNISITLSRGVRIPIRFDFRGNSNQTEPNIIGLVRFNFWFSKKDYQNEFHKILKSHLLYFQTIPRSPPSVMPWNFLPFIIWLKIKKTTNFY